jgi:phospholipid-binding lipoprotein MlaA
MTRATTATATACRFLAGAALAMALAGCATTRAGMGPGERLDPWEHWNRKVFAFNEGLDERVLKPVATGYAKVVPRPVRESIGNFFANFADAWSAVNNALQGKGEAATRDLARFTMNTVFGVFGLFDPASEAGLDHQYEDFGQTLGRWGVGAGAYLVWPLLGPSTVRETAALPLDRAASPALLIDGGASKVSIYALQVVNTRARLLNAGRVLDDIALDKYTFVRDAYLQRRRSLVFDGDEPSPAEPDTDAGAAASPLPPPAAAAPASAPSRSSR